MSQRVLTVALIVAGALTVLALLLFRADLARAARTGAPWKRRLVTAGLVVLAWLGLTSASPGQDKPAPAKPAASKPASQPASAPAAASDLDKNPKWQVILAAWKEVSPLAESGQSTNAQRTAADARLAAATAAADELAQAGTLAAAEAELLKLDAARLKQDMYRNPPVPVPGELPGPTCYDMAAVIPARLSAEQLAKRLPLLEALAAAKTVHPQVLAKTIVNIERDLATLRDDKAVAQLTGDGEQTKAVALRDKVQAQVDKLRSRLYVEDTWPASAPALTPTSQPEFRIPNGAECYAIHIFFPENSRLPGPPAAERLALLEQAAQAGELSPAALERARENLRREVDA